MPEDRGLSDFFGVLEDLKEHLPGLTLVGGWVPYLYANFLWRGVKARPVFTSDVDWGVSPERTFFPGRTVFRALSALGYSERHIELGKLQPVVFYRNNRTRLDFIAPSGGREAERFLGREVALSRLDDFGFLLKNTVTLRLRRGNSEYILKCPSPAAFVLHKCATFAGRADAQKIGKDLYYAYFVLRYAPDGAALLSELRGYGRSAIFRRARANVRAWFPDKYGRGCVYVRRENGPDEYIEDLAGDIFRRFDSAFNPRPPGRGF
ncbi:MAG: GSU2403 family nucleotidyltransferase fold protein [Elusimicrobiales bacterium]|nr:GSU2403 family nucleotidyltransferase fold protein [Elusimicrobiales bacterium]